MSGHHQMALVEWTPVNNTSESIYSVYRTDHEIELYPGLEKRENARLICTQTSYENAYEFCQILSEETGLPIKDFKENK